jgi:hypothetical protein
LKPVNCWFLHAILLAGLLLPVLTGSVQAGPLPGTAVVEFWRTGVQVDGIAPEYASLMGRGRSAAGQYHSSSGDSFYVLSAPGSTLKVGYALVWILARSGTYLNEATLSLEVRNLNGNLVRTLSQSPLDLRASPTTAWMVLPLTNSQKDRMVQPGEYLALHFQLGGSVGGNLDVQTLFEVGMSAPPYLFYFPMIGRQ